MNDDGVREACLHMQFLMARRLNSFDGSAETPGIPMTAMKGDYMAALKLMNIFYHIAFHPPQSPRI
jgi:hypothetical protein